LWKYYAAAELARTLKRHILHSILSLMPELLFSDFEAWNNNWETAFTRGVGSLPAVGRIPDSARPHVLNMLLPMTREVCQLQMDMGTFAVEERWSDLEAIWKSCTQKRREELALEGIRRAAYVAPSRSEERGWCPDLTVAGLATSGQSENGFLPILRKLMADGPESQLTVPKMISNEVVEQLLQSLDDDLCCSSIRTCRSYFMCMTVWQISLAIVSGLCIPSSAAEAKPCFPQVQRNRRLHPLHWTH